MKASLNFREDQRPLVRAKVPIRILGLPFLSGISAGVKSDLRLDLLTAFDSGPSVRASYRPNDPAKPFSICLKTGIGNLGSPLGAPMSMTAEFGFGGGNPNPSFSVLFKPRLGDFSFKKFAGSPEKKIPDVASESEGEGTAEWVENVHGINGKLVGVTGERWGLGDLLTAVEVTARSVLPIRDRAAVRFKWGVRVPAELRTAFAEDGNPGRISFGKLPLLVLSKISIEHVAGDGRPEKKKDDVTRGIADVADACMEVRRQLEAIQAENRNLRRAVEELRRSVPSVAAVGDVTKGGGNKSVAVMAAAPEAKGKPLPEASRKVGAVASAAPAKTKEKEKEDVNEELKKALMAATGGAGKQSSG